ENQADRVSELKRKDDVAVVDLVPPELPLQRRLENADHLAIDVVDRRGEEQQAADGPAEVAHPSRRCDGRALRGHRHWICSLASERLDGRVPSVDRELAMTETLGRGRPSRADADQLLEPPIGRR